MLIHLHKQATTTPKVRAVIQASDAPASVLAERFGTTEQTVYKWKHRNSVHDRSHTPHRLQTTLTPAQEAVRWFCAKHCWCRSTTCWRWFGSS
jgi:transposase-like protein